MVKNKSEAVVNMLMGIVFIAVGAVIIAMDNKETWVTVIVIADILLGAVLLISGIAGLAKKDKKAATTAPLEDAWDAPAAQEDSFDLPVAAPEREETATPVVMAAPQPEEPADEPSPLEQVEVLAAREAELRKVVKQRRADARMAKENAEAAAAAAAAAERELVDAENAMKHVSAAEKQAFLARIDQLADCAMDRSQQAAIAARKANVAERALAQAVEEHRAAMDAAAEAMLAAEDAGLM